MKLETCFDYFLTVGSLRTAGSPNPNEAYKYVKSRADNLIKSECAEADFMEKSRKNWRLAD
jgi:hypothetical protein